MKTTPKTAAGDGAADGLVFYRLRAVPAALLEEIDREREARGLSRSEAARALLSVEDIEAAAVAGLVTPVKGRRDGRPARNVGVRIPADLRERITAVPRLKSEHVGVLVLMTHAGRVGRVLDEAGFTHNRGEESP